MARRLLSIWFPGLASDVSLRSPPVEGPFALTLRASNAEHLHCLNIAARAAGLHRGMPLADARAICPILSTRPADLVREAGALEALRRWAGRYRPHAAKDGADGLIIDDSGVPHRRCRGAGRTADRTDCGSAAAVEPRAGGCGGAGHT